MDLIGQFHQELHDKHGILRIQSDIRVGTRTDKHQSPQDKLDVVYRKLNQNQQQQEEKKKNRCKLFELYNLYRIFCALLFLFCFVLVLVKEINNIVCYIFVVALIMKL